MKILGQRQQHAALTSAGDKSTKRHWPWAALQRKLTPGVQLQAQSTAPLCQADYVTRWKDWAQAESQKTNVEDCESALETLTSFLKLEPLDDKPRTLDLSHLDLTSVPELPPGVEVLNLAGNKLQSLPNRWPETLTHLSLWDNELNDWPAHLPKGLVQLDLSSNTIQRLATELPENLSSLDLSGNLISDLPPSIPGLQGQKTLIDLCLNPLSQESRDRLSKMNLAGHPDVPRVYFSKAHESDINNPNGRLEKPAS